MHNTPLAMPAAFFYDPDAATTVLTELDQPRDLTQRPVLRQASHSLWPRPNRAKSLFHNLKGTASTGQNRKF